MQRDVIRGSIKFIQARQADTLLLGHADGNKRIMPDDLHSEGARPPRHFHADAAEAGDSQRLAPQLRALQRFLFPPAGMHERVGAAEMASHGQHHAQRLFRHGHGICPGRVHHRDALARGRIQIDVVHAHAGSADHAQLLRMRQQRRIRLHRRAHNQRVGRFEMLRKLAIELVRGEHSPARFFQLLDR